MARATFVTESYIEVTFIGVGQKVHKVKLSTQQATSLLYALRDALREADVKTEA